MCFPFGAFSSGKKRKTASSSSSSEKKRPDESHGAALRGDGRRVTSEAREKRASTETPRKRRSRESACEEKREQHHHHHRAWQDHATAGTRVQYRAPLRVDVPTMWHRAVEQDSSHSSQEMLLNPKPHRSPHQRQKHPKRNSQTTLRGHGKRVKSKKSSRDVPSGWSLFAPAPPKTPKSSRRRDHYETLDSSPRSHRSSRQHRSPDHQSSPDSSRSQSRRHRSQQRHSSAARQATPNTAARRVPDRRFAVLAATNTALEDLRREAFANPSPPPRRERLRRYQGVTLPASSIPYSWDCVSSSQTSAGRGADPGARHGEGGNGRHRRRR